MEGSIGYQKAHCELILSVPINKLTEIENLIKKEMERYSALICVICGPHFPRIGF